MAETTRLKLPLMEAAQAQKHITHNEAIVMLDLLIGVIPALSRSLSSPPAGSSDGAVYIMGAAGSGAWSGFSANDLALMIDGGWRRVLPSTGMMACLASEGGLLIWFDGSNWTVSMSGGASVPAMVSVTGGFTASSTHFGSTVRLASASDVTVTLPANAPAGTTFSLLQVSAGIANFVPAPGASLQNADNHTRSQGRWTVCNLVVESNPGGTAATWVLHGSTQEGSWYDTNALLDADFVANRFRWDGTSYSDETAFLAAIDASKSGSTRLFGPYVDPTAPELLTNPNFDSGTTGWSGYLGATLSVVAGELVVDAQGGNSNGFLQPVTLAVGKAYRMGGTYRRGTTVSYASELRISANNVLNNAALSTVINSSSLTPTTSFVAGSAEATASYAGGRLHGTSNVGTTIFDNLSLKEATPFKTFVAGILSVVIEATTPAIISGTKVVFQADGGSTERNRIRAVMDATGRLRLIVTFGGVEQANLDLGIVAASTPFRLALSAINGAFAASLDGKPAVTAASGTFPGLGMVRLGASFTGETWDGVFGRVRVRSAILSAEECENLASSNVARLVVAWGDSLTASAGASGNATKYPAVAASLFSPTRAVANRGIGGQTSTQILDRLLADTTLRGRTAWLWMGRNGADAGHTVPGDIAAAVAALGHSRYLVGSILKASDPATLTDLERAGRFLYMQRLAFGGKVAGHFGVDPARGGRFNINKLAPLLEDIHERLAGVVIENRRWQDFVRLYDRPGTLFYLDPPYYGCEDDYGQDMFGRDEFAELASVLKGLKGTFIMSINDRPEIRELFAGFALIPVELTYTVAGGKNPKLAQELVITG